MDAWDENEWNASRPSYDCIEPTREERAYLSREGLGVDFGVLKANLTFRDHVKTNAAIVKTSADFGYSKVRLTPEDFTGENKLRLENVFLWFGHPTTWLQLVGGKEKPRSLLDRSIKSMTVEVLID